MGYEHNMSNEVKPGSLLPEGWREFEIVACIPKTSKAGNEMFVFTFSDCKTYQQEGVYAIAVKGKRWFLKQILEACGVAAAQDGVYAWDIPDVIGKIVEGRIEHYQDKFINREGKEVTKTKHKIVEVKISALEQKLKADNSNEETINDLLDASEEPPVSE